MTITEYLRRKDILQNTPFRILPNGKGTYLYNGKDYTREEFERLYPLPVSFVSHKNNVEGHLGWLVVK